MQIWQPCWSYIFLNASIRFLILKNMGLAKNVSKSIRTKVTYNVLKFQGCQTLWNLATLQNLNTTGQNRCQFQIRHKLKRLVKINHVFVCRLLEFASFSSFRKLCRDLNRRLLIRFQFFFLLNLCFLILFAEYGVKMKKNC